MDNYRSSYDNKNQMGRMSHFKNMFNSMRFKRAAGDNLDLGDRLVEKLAEQKHHMEAKIGNNIDIQAMKRDTQKYTMPSEWFKTKYEHLLDTCYEMGTNLPAEIAENSVVTGETQLTEHEFFPLVMQLLHGKEMDYMTGGMSAQLIQRWTDSAGGRLAPVLALITDCNYQPSSMIAKLAKFLCQV